MPPAPKETVGKDSDPEQDFFKPTHVFDGNEAELKECREFYEKLRQQDPPDDIGKLVEKFWWARDPDYCFTSLHIMLIYNHTQLFEDTLKKYDRNPSPDIMKRLPNGERLIFFRAPDKQSLLHVAIVNNRWESAITLLLYIMSDESGLKPRDRFRFLRARDSEGSTALMLAAERGHGALVKELVKYESGMADDRGFTALMRAYISPRREIDGFLNSGMECEEAHIPARELADRPRYDDSDDPVDAGEEEDHEEQPAGPLVTEFLLTYRGPYLPVVPNEATPERGVSQGFLNPCYLDTDMIAEGFTLELTPSRSGVHLPAGAAPGAKLIWKKPSSEAKKASEELVALAKWFGAAKRGNRDYVSTHMNKMYKAVVPQLCSTDALMFCSLHRQGEIAKILAPKLYTRADANNYTALYKAAEYISIEVANVLAPFQHGRPNDEADDTCYAVEEAMRAAAIPLFKLLAPYELWIDLAKFRRSFEEACAVNDAQADASDPDASAKDDDYDELKELLSHYEKEDTDEARDAKLHFRLMDAIRKDDVAALKAAIKDYEAKKQSITKFLSHIYPVDKKKARYDIVSLALIYDKHRADSATGRSTSTNVLTYLGTEYKEFCKEISTKLNELGAKIDSDPASLALVVEAVVPAAGQ